MLSHKFMDTKLIEGSQFSHDEGKSDGYGKKIQERVSEILNSIEMDHQALVIKKDYRMVLNSTNYERNWLGTADALGNLGRWTVLEDERVDLQTKINNKMAGRFETDAVTLSLMLEKKSESVFKYVFAAKKALILSKIYDTFSSSKRNNQKWTFVEDFAEKGQLELYKSIRMFSRGDYRNHYCQCCEAQPKAMVLKRVKIHQYTDLMFLLNINDRKELPLYFRNYKHNSFIPYKGNSILENTHPYALLVDPCSKDFPNGIIIDILMCKRCYTKFSKKYSQGVDAIVFDSDGSVVNTSDTNNDSAPVIF